MDTAVSGYRVRDVRNGLTIPPQLTLKGMIDLGVRPGYWTKMLASPKIEFANVSSAGGGGYTIENITAQFDPSVDWADVRRIREQWPGRLVLKGPVGPQDAQRAKEIGLDGVHLSNHGGRANWIGASSRSISCSRYVGRSVRISGSSSTPVCGTAPISPPHSRWEPMPRSSAAPTSGA